MGDLGSGEDGISPIPCGSGMENGVNRARSGGIDQGKPVFGTFKGEAKVMGNPSKNPSGSFEPTGAGAGSVVSNHRATT